MTGEQLRALQEAGWRQGENNTFVMRICDLPHPEHPGKSYRQVNAEMTHIYPIGALVEIQSDDDDNGIRLFVVSHHRDCDESLLYCLGTKDSEEPLMRGVPEYCLQMIPVS